MPEENAVDPPMPTDSSSAAADKPVRKLLRESLLAHGFGVLPTTGGGLVIGGVRVPKDKA